jgi:2-keto-4-pentenoate hydratase
VRAVADAIAAARAAGRTLDAPAGGVPLTEAEAYAVQDLRTRDRLSRGERIVGWKLGYTSSAMRAQMGVERPNYGPLTDAMVLADGAALPPAVLHPRVEPEVALVLGRDLTGAVSREEAATAVREARPALEVVDSVWTDYRFTLADNTADGSSAAYLALGGVVLDTPVAGLDRVEAVLRRNGEVVGTGTGADALGHPLDALAWLAARLGERGLTLRPGDVVITGGLSAAVPLRPGDSVTATIGGQTVTLTRREEADRTVEELG